MTIIAPSSNPPGIPLAVLQTGEAAEALPRTAAGALPDRAPTPWLAREWLERLPVAAYACDADAVVVAYNERAAALWGRRPGHGDGEAERYCGAYRLYQPDGNPLAHGESPMAEALVTGRAVRDTELVVERPDGSRATVLVNVTPLVDETGALGGAVCCLQDITPWKQAIELLHQARGYEALGQLTESVAHDFSNLLATITLNLNLIGRRLGDPLLLRFVRATQRVVERGAALTEKLCAQGRRQEPLLARADLNVVVAGMRDLLARMAGPDIRIRFRLADNLWPALLDRRQIELAILNLVMKARDAMPNGGSLTVQTGNRRLGARQAELPPGDYVVLSVLDSGDRRSREMEHGAGPIRAPTAKDAEPCIAPVLGVTQRHGGAVRIDARAGQGTMVSLYLPRAPGVMIETLGAEGRRQPRMRPPAAKSCAATIVVADDDPDLRSVAVDELQRLGYKAVPAATGESALAIVKSGLPIELLIVDYGMMGMSGLDVVHSARAIRPDLRVLVMTGYLDTPRLAAAVGPAIAILRKPFRAGEFEASVRRAIAGSAMNP
ncbi:MAG TPA: response regulator [Alphaproteobacteria bacterium]|nr:response regulator [Alphaproteobacteria bacterium]